MAEQVLLRGVCREVFQHMQPEIYAELQVRDVTVHVAPKQCSYTTNKQRIYIRVHDNGVPYSRCQLRTVLLHEIVHVLYPGSGHDNGFSEWEHALQSSYVQHMDLCDVPRSYNPCTD